MNLDSWNGSGRELRPTRQFWMRMTGTDPWCLTSSVLCPANHLEAPDRETSREGLGSHFGTAPALWSPSSPPLCHTHTHRQQSSITPCTATARRDAGVNLEPGATSNSQPPLLLVVQASDANVATADRSLPCSLDRSLSLQYLLPVLLTVSIAAGCTRGSSQPQTTARLILHPLRRRFPGSSTATRRNRTTPSSIRVVGSLRSRGLCASTTLIPWTLRMSSARAWDPSVLVRTSTRRSTFPGASLCLTMTSPTTTAMVPAVASPTH